MLRNAGLLGVDVNRRAQLTVSAPGEAHVVEVAMGEHDGADV